MSASRTAMVNEWTNFMKSSAVSVLFIVLVIGYCKSDPHCKVILVRTACYVILVQL